MNEDQLYEVREALGLANEILMNGGERYFASSWQCERCKGLCSSRMKATIVAGRYYCPTCVTNSFEGKMAEVKNRKGVSNG